MSDRDSSPDASTQPTAGGWRAVMFVLKAVEIRLRFVLVLIVLGLVIGYWDTIRNYWDKWTRPPAPAVSLGSGSEFYCPMHPSVVRETLDPDGTVPDCPICGMPLSKRKKGETPTLPPGIVSRAQFSPERIQMAGIRTVSVEYRPLVKEVRTVGQVAYDESRLSRIVPRFDGYVEKLFVNKTFQIVAEGEPLAEIYSPELYAAAQEFRIAHEGNARHLIELAHEKLRLLGVGEEEIRRFHRQGQAGTTLTIRSPRTGHVIRKDIVDGSRFETGMTLWEIADLSMVWVEADVYEKDVPFVKVDQPVEATVESLPGEVFQGKVSLIHPHLELPTRTNRVRVELENKDHKLRPGMYATVVLKVPVAELEPFRSEIAARRISPSASAQAMIAAQRHCPVTGLKLGSMGTPVVQTIGERSVYLCCPGCLEKLHASPQEYLARVTPPPPDAVLAVPRLSVIDTGTQKVVYVEREPGLFEGVDVALGPRAGEFHPVLGGLLPGDRVAAAGAFLIDAETRLNPAAAATYFGASGGPRHDQEPSSQPSREPASPSAAPKKPPFAKDELPWDVSRELAQLPADDRALALRQKLCPVTHKPLGWMGRPYKIVLDGRPVFLCCRGCEVEAREHAGRTAPP